MAGQLFSVAENNQVETAGSDDGVINAGDGEEFSETFGDSIDELERTVKRKTAVKAAASDAEAIGAERGPRARLKDAAEFVGHCRWLQAERKLSVAGIGL